VSTDLSPTTDRRTASELDRRAAATVVARQPEALGRGDACGVFPLRGVLEAARRHSLDVELLDLRTSADTAGTPAGVVGCGAFASPERGRATGGWMARYGSRLVVRRGIEKSWV
jgi:MEMO1 family protein